MKTAVISLCLLLASCGSPVFVPNYLADPETGAPIMWASYEFPIRLYVDDSMSPENREAVVAAVARWNETLERKVFAAPIFVSWDVAEDMRLRRGNVVILQKNLPEGVLGRTIYNTVPVITEGDIVEPSRMMWAHVFLDDSIGEGCHDLVALHELGHVLGLAHDQDRRSVMYLHACESGGRIMPSDVDYVEFQLP